MLTPRFRYGDKVVVLDVPATRTGGRRLLPSVVRAADGSCRPCSLALLPPSSWPLARDERERIAFEIALLAQVPTQDPWCLHCFERDGALVAVAERAALPLSLSDVVSGLRRAREQAPIAAAVGLLQMLIELGATVDPVALARSTLPFEDVRVGFEGRFEARPRAFLGEQLTLQGANTLGVSHQGVSPEALAGATPDVRQLMFSMGSAVYGLVALEEPYPPEDGVQRIDERPEAPMRWFARFRPDIAPPFIALVDAMIARSPDERPADFAAVTAKASALPVDADAAAAWSATLARLFPAVRDRVAREAHEFAITRFDDLLARCEPSDDTVERAPPPLRKPPPPASPAALFASTDELVWPGDGRAMRRVAARLCVDAEPVSCSHYARFLEDAGRRAPSDWPEGRVPLGRADAPVVRVSLEDARAYARWAKKRLPLHDDWLAAMNTLGFAALAGGQVWEWTASRHHGGFIVRGGRYRDQPHIEPTPLHQSWDDGPADDIGFRCVADG